MPLIVPRWISQESLDPSRRVQWMDASRGLIILIIAIYHASETLIKARINAHAASHTIYPLTGIGMGLFFLLAGMNSRKYIHGTWRLAWRRRLGPLLWVLAVWVPIYWLFNDILLPNVNQASSVLISHLIYGFLTPAWGLWFLWSMALYFTVGKLLNGTRSSYVIIPFGVISFIGLCTSIWHLKKYGLGWFADNYNWRGTACYFLFFYVGNKYTSNILRFSALSLPKTMLVSTSLGFAAVMLDGLIPSIFINGPLRLVALISGLVTAISIGRLLSPISFIKSIGAATLPVYLIHPLLISLLIGTPLFRSLFAQLDNPILPVVIGITCAMVSLLVARLLVYSNAKWLFSPPPVLIQLHDNFLREKNDRQIRTE